MANYLLNAEVRCFDYLLGQLGGLEGVAGYRGKWPIKTADIKEGDEVVFIEWMFRITGDGDNVADMVGPQTAPRTGWLVSAELAGRFADRDTALKFAGQLLGIAPVTLENIQQFGPAAGSVPVISDEVYRIGETGYEQDIYNVTLDMAVAFDLIDEPDIA